MATAESGITYQSLVMEGKMVDTVMRVLKGQGTEEETTFVLCKVPSPTILAIALANGTKKISIQTE